MKDDSKTREKFFADFIINRSLKIKFAFFSAALIISVISVFTIIISLHEADALKTELKRQLTANVNYGVATLERFYEDMETKIELWSGQPIVQVFFNNPALAAISYSGLSSFFTSIKSKELWIVDILLIDNGNIIYKDNGLQLKNSDLYYKTILQACDSSSSFVIDMKQIESGFASPLLVISRKFSKDGVVQKGKLIVLTINLAMVDEKLFGKSTIGKRGFITLAAMSSNQKAVFTRHNIEAAELKNCKFFMSSFKNQTGFQKFFTENIQSSEIINSDLLEINNNSEFQIECSSMLVNYNTASQIPVSVISVASPQDIRESVLKVVLISIVFGIIASIFSIAGVLVLAEHITKPLVKLTEKVSQSVFHDPEKQTPDTKDSDIQRDEINMLEKYFDIMFARIQEYTESLEEKVFQRTEELEAAKTDLLIAKDTAEQSWQSGNYQGTGKGA